MKEFQGCRKSLSISLWIGRVLRRDWPPSLDQIKIQFHIPPHFLKFEGPHKKKLMKVHTTTTAVFVINRKRFKYFPFFLFCCVCRRTGTGFFLFKPPQIKKYLFCRFRVGFTLRRIPSAPNQTKEEEEPYCSTNFLL
jgi:hypothetical protein